MNLFPRFLLAGLTLLAFLPYSPAQPVEPFPPVQETVPINGLAYWATTPTMPDFQGVKVIPFPARNPTPDTWEMTLAQNERYLEPAALPDNIQVSHSGWITGATHYVNDFSEVMVYLDPTDPNHLLGASKFFFDPQNYGFYTGVFESYDGGYSWTELQPPGVEGSGYTMTSDPVTTFDDQGNGYFTLLTRGPTGVDMLKKPVGGDWEWPVIVDRTTSTDKQWIMADQDPQGISPYAGNLYMSWTSFGGPVTGIVVSRSTDGNQSWSSPISVGGGNVQGSIPGVAPDGTVYVVYGRDIFYGSPGTMEIVASNNGGVSFGAPVVAANMTSIPYYLPDPFGNPYNFRSPASLPAFAVSPVDGNLYIAWSDYRHGDADIYFTRSVDGGATWDTAVRLNDDPVGNGIDQFQPQVSVSPSGRVAVMWFDRRLPCPDLPWIPPAHVGVYNGCIDTFMTRSFDEGQTWVPNIRASTQTWDWTLNLPITGGNAGFIGDYQGIASNDAYDFPFWNATANLGENDENYQEIFIAMVPVIGTPDLTPSTKTASFEAVYPGGLLTYTVLLQNGGITDTLAAQMTDTLPLSTTFVAGSLWSSSGNVSYDPGARAVNWDGAVLVGDAVTVTFAVTAALDLADGAEIVNSAWITDGFGVGFWRTVTTTVAVPPYVAATAPVDGAVAVPLTATVVITFSEAMSTASLSLTVTPDPGGWSAAWGGGDTVVTLTHDVFAEATHYTATVWAEDVSGEGLVAGPAPNPWAFASASIPPYVAATAPVDGAVAVPLTATVVITFSEAMSTASLSLTVTPDPGGWNAAWGSGDTVVILTHDAFSAMTVYTITAWAESVTGEALVAGPAPNPWSFTTAEAEGYWLYLPLIMLDVWF